MADKRDVHVWIQQDVLREAKIEAIRQGRTLTEIVNELLKAWLIECQRRPAGDGIRDDRPAIQHLADRDGRVSLPPGKPGDRNE